MTVKEVARLLAFITAVYPNIDIRQGTVEAWTELLGDLPYDVALAGVKKVLSQQEYPALPAVGKIRFACLDLTTTMLPSAMEAWAEVTRAIGLYGYYRQEEAMAYMSPMVVRVVRMLGWRDICLSEEPEILRAQFRKAYEAHVTRDREVMVLPADIRKMITDISVALPGLPRLIS